MFRLKSSFVLLLLLSVCTVSYAETTIAVFSPQEAILGSKTAKSRIKILLNSKRYKDKKSRFEQLQKDGEKLVKKFKTDSDVMSVKKKNEIQEDLKKKEKKLSELLKSLRDEEIRVNQKLLQEISPRLERAVKSVVKSKKISLLLDKNTVIHADESHDVTSLIIKELNK
jgi:outer membrane protein